MSEERRKRPSGPGGQRGGRPGAGGNKGRGSGDQDRRRGPGEQDRRPRSGGPAGQGGRPGGRSQQWRRPQDDRRRAPEERTADQKAYDGPDLPPEVTGKELDPAVSGQLKGLPEKLAARIARHLAAAGMFVESDPELAYQHARAAKSRASRLAVVREAAGEAAYAAGHYAEALSDLRAAKRMNGATAYLPIMADCHRALGQPEQALKLAASPSVKNFAPAAKAEMTIVAAGARRDLGQYDAALRTLEQAPLMNKTRESWVVRLRYAYADTLAEAGRAEDALTWFHRAHAIDGEEITDAATRAEELEKLLGD